MRQVFAAYHVLNQAERHPDASRSEADMPVDILAEVTAYQRRDERANVDAHVKDREARVAALVFRTVELADNRARVRFEQPRAQDDQYQSYVERISRRH